MAGQKCRGTHSPPSTDDDIPFAPPGDANPKGRVCAPHSLCGAGAPTVAAGVRGTGSSCLPPPPPPTTLFSALLKSSTCLDSRELNPAQRPGQRPEEVTLERASCTRWAKEAITCGGATSPALSARWMGTHTYHFIPEAWVNPAWLPHSRSPLRVYQWPG